MKIIQPNNIHHIEEIFYRILNAKATAAEIAIYNQYFENKRIILSPSSSVGEIKKTIKSFTTTGSL